MDIPRTNLGYRMDIAGIYKGYRMDIQNVFFYQFLYLVPAYLGNSWQFVAIYGNLWQIVANRGNNVKPINKRCILLKHK